MQGGQDGANVDIFFSPGSNSSCCNLAELCLSKAAFWWSQELRSVTSSLNTSNKWSQDFVKVSCLFLTLVTVLDYYEISLQYFWNNFVWPHLKCISIFRGFRLICKIYFYFPVFFINFTLYTLFLLISKCKIITIKFILMWYIFHIIGENLLVWSESIKLKGSSGAC